MCDIDDLSVSKVKDKWFDIIPNSYRCVASVPHTEHEKISIGYFSGIFPIDSNPFHCRIDKGEWITEVKDIIPPDSEKHMTQTRDVFRHWVDSQVMNANTRSRLEAENNPVDFSHDLCDSLAHSLPKTITAQAMQTADVGVRLTLVREWMETQIAQDPAKSLALRFDQLEIPPDIHSKLDVELSLLQRSTTNSADREKLLTYLQFAAALPWGDHARPPNTGLAEARADADRRLLLREY